MRIRRALILAGSIALVLGACSGSGDTSTDEGGASTPDSGQTPSDDTVAAVPDDDGSEIPDDVSEHFDTAGGTATVTVGAQTWEFQLFDEVPIASCDADFFGGYVAVLTSGDNLAEPYNQVGIVLPGGNLTDPPSINININVGGDTEWIADETIYERAPDLPVGIGVTDFTIDGLTASGSALFVDEESMFQFNAGNVDEPILAEGSFAVTCAEDG